MERARRPIELRVFFLVAVGMLGPLGVIAWARWSAQRAFEGRALAERTLVASFLAERLDGVLAAELEALHALADRVSAQTDAARRASLREAWLRRRSLFDALFVLGSDGTPIAAEPQAARVDARAALAEAARTVRSSFSDAIGGSAYAVVPLRSWGGARGGVLGGMVDPRAPHLAALLRGHAPRPGETVDVVDGDGVVLASSDPSRVLGRARPSAVAHVGGQRHEAGAAIVEGRDGKTVEASSALSLARWRIVVRQPYGEALAFSSAVSREVLSWSLLALAAALLFAFGASRSAILERRVNERTQQLQRLNRELQAREEKVRQLFGKVLHAQEDERRRVARELHDETTQALVALSLKVHTLLARAPPGELYDGLQETAALAGRTLDEVHRLIADLRPSVLDDLGLTSAIQWYAARNLKTRGIGVRCEFAGLDHRLPPQIETVVFRIVQEALTNVARHAHASNVLIQGGIEDGHLALEVEDDGAGFDWSKNGVPAADSGSGWGLLGMRERVDMLGGTLRVDSAPGKGTHVTLAVPLPEPGGAHA